MYVKKNLLIKMNLRPAFEIHSNECLSIHSRQCLSSERLAKQHGNFKDSTDSHLHYSRHVLRFDTNAQLSHIPHQWFQWNSAHPQPVTGWGPRQNLCLSFKEICSVIVYPLTRLHKFPPLLLILTSNLCTNIRWILYFRLYTLNL